jgi:membrane-associated phospholipid phosphatase
MPVVVHRNPDAPWYRRCWRVDAPLFLISLANTIKFFCNPIILSLGCEALLVFLYHMSLPNKSEMQLQLMEMHHFVLPPMVTVVGLYVLFRQRRPGLTVTENGPVSFGTYYGMPSGDSMFFGIVGGLLWSKGKRILGVIVPVIVALERVVLGLHDASQVIVGVAFGVGVYWLFTTQNWARVIEVNWALAFFAPLVVFFDPALRNVRKGDFDNLQGWVIIDMGYLWFDVIYCAPERMVIADEGIRLWIAAGGAMIWHIVYYFQSLNGISFVKFGK